MPEYRFYTITKDDHINAPPVSRELPDDAAALREAQQWVDGHAVEIWQGARRVAHLDPKD